MKICTDENVSPVLTAMLNTSGVVSAAHVLHDIDAFRARGVADEIWVRKFAKAGGDAIVGADAMMLQRPHEIVAICDSGLRVVVLPPNWARSKIHLQASFMFLWWPRIEEVIAAAKPRECFKVPWTLATEVSAGAIKPISLDFQEALKKMKKADRRKG